MRIRKSGKLHACLLDGTLVPLETFQTHVCQLNQSPWDVIPFDSASSLFEGEDGLAGNGNPVDSVAAVESEAVMMDVEDNSQQKIEDNNMKNKAKVDNDNGGREHENGIEFNKGEEKPSHCQKTDGKGWQCKNPARAKQSFCEHHLSLLRSYKSGSSNTTSKKVAATTKTRRARGHPAKKAATSFSPYEFYYYSGFGPWWGKKRGKRNVEGTTTEPKIIENTKIIETASTNVSPTEAAMHDSAPSSSSQKKHKEFAYVNVEEEDGSNGDGGKKRMRKQVKAKSLKSLM